MHANQHPRTLIIEDRAATRLTLGRFYVHRGWTVRSATDLAAALVLGPTAQCMPRTCDAR